MRQRVAFLRTLLAGKPVLLLDEPFASLDAITRAEMQEWLAAALAAEPATALLVTHDVEEALYLCDRVVVLTARPARASAAGRLARAAQTPRAGGGHLAGVHGGPRAGAGGAARRGAAMRRWLRAAPIVALAVLLGALGAGGALGPDRRRARTSSRS